MSRQLSKNICNCTKRSCHQLTSFELISVKVSRAGNALAPLACSLTQRYGSLNNDIAEESSLPQNVPCLHNVNNLFNIFRRSMTRQTDDKSRTQNTVINMDSSYNCEEDLYFK